MASPLIIVNGKLSNPSPTEPLTTSKMESVSGELLTLQSDTGVVVSTHGVTIPISSVNNPNFTSPADSIVGAINALSTGSSDAIKIGDAAGGSLSGTFPNPGLSTTLNDPAQTTPGLRSIGTGATQAAAGNHTHPIVTINDAGLMSATDKTKLDGLVPGITDHGALTGLSDDDHPQYLNNTRGDARYSLTSHTHAVATTSTAGFLSGADKAKLDSALTTGSSAGGSLGGTYPNPTLAADSVTETQIVAALKDPAATTVGLRTLGTGATQAAAGNHTHAVASTTVAGFMSPEDKTKLDGIIPSNPSTITDGAWSASVADATGFKVTNGVTEFIAVEADGDIIIKPGLNRKVTLSGPTDQYFVESTNSQIRFGTKTSYFSVNSVAPGVITPNGNIYILGTLNQDQSSRGSNKASSMLAAINASNPDFAFYTVAHNIIQPPTGTALTNTRIPVESLNVYSARAGVWGVTVLEATNVIRSASVSNGVVRFIVRLTTPATSDMHFTLVANTTPLESTVCDITLPAGQVWATDAGILKNLPANGVINLYVSCADPDVSVEIQKATVDIQCNASPLPSIVS